jgi:23S rRNA pseudouridine2605 synthase
MMTEQDLQQLRSHKWHLDGNPVRTLDQARDFIVDVGFCVMYPARTLQAVPSFMGAFAGSGDNLPDSKHAFADPRTPEATELMIRLLRERSAYEMNLSPGTDLVVSASLFPYFHSLVADPNPKIAPRVRTQGATISLLAVDVFNAIQKNGPVSKDGLRQLVSRELSDAALDRSLGELWSILKIVRVNYREGEGTLWDVLYRWSPGLVKEALDISEPEAISALLSKFLENAGAATQDEIEAFFSHLTSRSKVREAINALLSARELNFVSAGAKTLIRLAPVPEPRRRING